MNKKLLVCIVLSILLIFPTVAYGQIDVNVELNGSNTTLDIESSYIQESAAIKIVDHNRIYLVDQYTTDEQGAFQVTLKLPADSTFNGKIHIQEETKEFTINTSEGENPGTNPIRKFVNVVIRGYDGVILSAKTIEIKEGDSVLDVLKVACHENNISLSYESNGYVKSIEGLSQGDKGPLSGWKYDVNGNTPNIASSNYDLNGGEFILWYYVKTPSNTSTNTGFNESDKLSEVLDKVDNIIQSKNKTEEELKNVFNELLAIEDIDSSDSKFNQYLASIQAIAEMRVEKAGTVPISGKVSVVDSKDTVEADVTLKEISDAIKRAGDTVDSIKNAINKKEFNLDKNLESKITLAINGEVKKDVSLSFPGEITKELAENNIKEVIIDTGIAHINLPVSELESIEEKVGASDKLTIRVAEMHKEDLPENMKEQVPEGSYIYNFDLMHEGTKISHFNNPIEITIPYNGNVEDVNGVTVIYIHDNNELEIVGGRYNPQSNTVKFMTNHFSSFFAKAYNVKFYDIEGMDWAKESIERMAVQGIIKGTSDGQFKPKDDVTRPEIATMILRMLKYSKLDENRMPFEDIATDSWYHDNVKIIYQKGIMGGKNDKEFGTGPLTRQELAKIIGDILIKEKGHSFENSETLEKFSDYTDIADWAKNQVTLVAEKGIIKGFEDNSFRPEEKVTRAECTVMLRRLYDVVME